MKITLTLVFVSIFSMFASRNSSLEKRASIRSTCYSLHKDFRIRLFALSIVVVSNEAR